MAYHAPPGRNCRRSVKRFHSAEYWSHGRPFNKWNEEKWKAAQLAICEAISSVQLLGVGVALDVELFKNWRLTLDQYYPEDPYYFCLDRVLYRLITGISENPEDEGVTIYIDRDQEYEKIGNSIAQWHIDRLKYDPSIGTHAIGQNRSVDTHYGSSHEFKPLQLADILAHASFQKLRNKLSNNDDPRPAKIFVDAMKAANYHMQVYEYPDLWHLQIDLRTRFKNRDGLDRYDVG